MKKLKLVELAETLELSGLGGRNLQICLGLCLCALFAVAMSAWGQDAEAVGSNSAPTFASFEVTGAGTGASQGTVAVAINATGEVTGIYIDSSGLTHGFVRANNGVITPFDAPGAGKGKNQGTFAMSINAGGVVAGWYADASNAYHGFVREANGTITSFNAPGAGTAGHRGTTAMSINAAGVITGAFTDEDAVFHGFLRAADGTFTTFNVAGAGSSANSDEGTVPFAINAAGMVTGYYKGATGGAQGFVRAANGAIATFDGSSVSGASLFQGTNPVGIDAAGDVSGTYVDTSGKRHAFLRRASGAIVSFNAPAAETTACAANGPGAVFCGTGAIGINTAGDITGVYVDPDGLLHGFLRLANGTLNSFEAPGAGTSPGGLIGTAGIGINDSGRIAGAYADAGSVFHGYVFTPALISTSASLTSAPAASVYGEPVTLTAKVTSSEGAPPNGEDVVFMNGKDALGTKAMSGGSASLTTTALPVGSDSITAVYSGDLNFAGSTSKAVIQPVGKARSFTKLASSKNPSVWGEPVTFTATVTGQFGGTATGTVTFRNGSTQLAKVTVSRGEATFTITALPVDTDSITADYSGDAHFSASTSEVVKQVVGKARTTATLASSVNPSKPAQSVTFTATIKGQFGGTPAGTVTFSQGKTVLKVVTLSGGAAKFITSTLPLGTDSITAVYGADSEFDASTSNVVKQVVSTSAAEE